MEIDIQKASEIIRNKTSERKTSELESESKDRMKNILSKRDNAIKKIEEYQDKTVIPTDDEVDGTFLSKEAKINIKLDEYIKKYCCYNKNK